MKYVQGDLWKTAHENSGWIVVPTNMLCRKDGKAVMGAGVAKDAAELYPDLPVNLGEYLRSGAKPLLYIEHPIICLPTKVDWRDPSDLDLIENGCFELANFARVLHSLNNYSPIYLPRLGCGLGGLNWERQVRPVLDVILDDRFVLVQND